MILHLDLSGNRLTTVDGAFTGMKDLSRLDLSGNRLASLTQFTLRDLNNLRFLFLANNTISSVDKRAFRGLEKLSQLVLRGNPIGGIPVGVQPPGGTPPSGTPIGGSAVGDGSAATAAGGVTVRFQFNSLSLSYVDLSECSLTRLPRGLPSSIRYLQLRRNNLTTVSRNSFKDYPYTSILVLDENQVSGDVTFNDCSYTRVLVLVENQVSGDVPVKMVISS